MMFSCRAADKQKLRSLKIAGLRSISLPAKFLLVCILLLPAACGSKPIDPRTAIPADALVYLETKDLGAAIGTITESEKFAADSSKKPDLSAITGLRLSIAVTGFETTEHQVTDDQFIGQITPRFVAVAETNAWGWQARGFVENKIGEFINDVYGGDVLLETFPKHDGQFYTWTSPDGRKAFALVQGSVVLFGNDESAIEKCIAVRRGEAESIAGNTKLPAGDNLAFGYVSSEGVAQIANLAGASFAVSASENGEVMSFIARVVPEVVRNSVSEATWTAMRADTGIEDRFTVKLAQEAAKIFAETMTPDGPGNAETSGFVPADAVSVTRYGMKEPQIAWRSVLLTAEKQTDAVSGKLLVDFSSALFEPYGIADPELFLSAVKPGIYTAKFDSEGDRQIVIAGIGQWDMVMRSIDKEIDFTQKAEDVQGGMLWKSKDGEMAAAFVLGTVVVGDTGSVQRAIAARSGTSNLSADARFKMFAASDAVAVTFAKDSNSGLNVAKVLGEPKEDPQPGSYIVESRFNQNGLERRVISDFGFLGTIIEQLARE